SLADALKGAMEDPTWPVSFIVSGLPMVTELARLDEQFERRNMMIELLDIDDGERSLVENIIRKLTAAAELECEPLIASDVPER
ncbi:hypothetical protein H8J56_27525, partial [Klebsiella sp. Kps]|uniref:hypothetical protein n=1 Tax=Klebsiella sp. Kps TaxID=2758579 RepID=UPI0019870324